MSPLIQPVVNAVRSWATGTDQESPGVALKRRQALKFDDKYPKAADPLKYSAQQKLDLMTRLGMASVGNNEIDLALSRCPADTDFATVSEFVRGVITAFRAENSEDPDSAAARKLLEGSSSLAAIDGKLEAARLATEAAQAAEQAFDKAFMEFRSIPGKHKAVSDKISGLEAERQRLTSINFDAKIRQLIEIELNPTPGIIVAESISSLLLQRDTLKPRLEVIANVLEQCRPALAALESDNKRLARELDLPAHNL